MEEERSVAEGANEVDRLRAICERMEAELRREQAKAADLDAQVGRSAPGGRQTV
jgi:hypothetical protein